MLSPIIPLVTEPKVGGSVSNRVARLQELPAVNCTLVDVIVPYVVEFVRWKKRKLNHVDCWEKRSVAFRAAAAEELSAICHVRSVDGITAYSVLSYEGAIWWPLFSDGDRIDVERYVGSARDSSGIFLTMMNLSPSTVQSPRREIQQFLDNSLLRKWDAPLREERCRRAQAIADKTLFCDGLVYFKGGYPAYYAVDQGGPNSQTIAFEVGSADPEIEAVARYLPGPSWSLKRRAARRSFVYGAEELETAIKGHRDRGVRTILSSIVDADVQILSSQSAAELCAMEFASWTISRMSPSSLNEISALLGGRRLGGQSAPTMTLSLAVELIDAMIELCPATGFEERYGSKYEWAIEARSRLDAISPRLSKADTDILAEIAG